MIRANGSLKIVFPECLDFRLLVSQHLALLDDCFDNFHEIELNDTSVCYKEDSKYRGIISGAINKPRGHLMGRGVSEITILLLKPY